MGIFRHLKLLYWHMRNPSDRFGYINYLVKDIPGDIGEAIRRRIYQPYFQQAGKNLLILTNVRFQAAHNIRLGDNVAFGVDNIIQASGGLEVGDDSMTGPGVKIWTVNHKFDQLDVPIRDQGYDLRPVRIGKGVWIGANAFIMPGVEIPDGCIVSAGAIVGIKKYLPYSIIAGNPARVIGNRKTNQSDQSDA